MKRTLALFLSLLMVFSVFSCLNISAAENGNAEVGANYNLWLGSTRVTDANKNDILGDGTASFDSNTNTLRLNDPIIKTFYTDTQNVWTTSAKCKFYVSGMNLTVIGCYHTPQESGFVYATPDFAMFVKDGSVTFKGDFEMTGLLMGVAVEQGNLTIAGGKMNATGSNTASSNPRDCYGMYASGTITLSSFDSVRAIGFEKGLVCQNLIVDDSVAISGYLWSGDYAARCHFDSSMKTVLSDDVGEGGHYARIVNIETPQNKKYDIYLGYSQVTDANKSDILYDGGKAKYDPDTGTLTLDNPDIINTYQGCKIYNTESKTLILKGTYHMSSNANNYGIYSRHGDIKVNGNFTFMGKEGAVAGIEAASFYLVNSMLIEPQGGYVNNKPRELHTVCDKNGRLATVVKTVPSVTISFDSNGGSGYMESVKVAKNTWYELPECAFAPPAGQEFRCWQAGTYVNPGSTINPSIDTTVKAIWRTADGNKCTVSFDPNGGSGTMYNVTVNKGSFYNAPECTFTAPEGKQFSHWTLNGERFDGATIRENTVLKASWVGAQIAYMDCSIAEPVVGSRPSYTIDVPYGAAYQQEWNYTGGLWGDGVAWEEVGGDAINYRSDYTFKPGRTYQVTISLVPVGGATFAQLSALRGYIDGKEAECFRYNASNVTLVRTFRTPESTILGDVDGDGEVTIIDATYIQRHLASIPIPFVLDEAIADTDEDGLVSIMDATYIQRWIASLPSNENIGKPV